MDKREKLRRQEMVLELIRAKRIGSQKELLDELARRSIQTTQASVSRDLIELSVVKIKGIYRLPSVGASKVSPGEIIEVSIAGDNLIVVKTPPGQASMTALAVDQRKIPGVVGTVAGDDTFFVAVKSPKELLRVSKQILELVK